MPKKHVIITTTDEKFEDFVVNHWLKSLQDNVNLENIDVVIFDYGLRKEQVTELKKKKIIVKKYQKVYRVNNIRFRDVVDFLNKNKYDQVMVTDGGDLIFQTDISPIFEKNKIKIRAACEDYNLGFEEVLMKNSFYTKYEPKIKEIIKKTKMINVGVLLGPSIKFKKMAKECYDMIKAKDKFGPEQIAINYLLYRDGFHEMDNGYNFVVQTAKKKIRIKDGVFYYKKSGEKIPIVHNAGGFSFYRPIADFGYGKNKNKIKLVISILKKVLFPIHYFFSKK